MNETIVVFRKDRTGWKDCFALFPELPSGEFGRYCTAHQRVGQHCAADYYGCISRSDPTTPAEYANLLKELEQRGYILFVRRRAPPDMHERRRRIAAEWRGAAMKKQLASAAR